MKRIDTDNTICILMNGDVYIHRSPVSYSLIIANSSEKVEIRDFEFYNLKLINLLIYLIDKEMFTIIDRNKIDYPYTVSLNWKPITSDMKEFFAEKLMQ